MKGNNMDNKNISQEEKQIDIPTFLKGKVKKIISMPEPEFKDFMHRFYMDGVRDGKAVGTIRGFILGALITILMYIVYATCFATHMLPMAGP